jgi:acyl carrier protein
MRDELVETIARVLQCAPAGLSNEAGLGKHPRWDSLGHITVMLALEDVYGIKLSEENVSLLVTIGDIRIYLKAKEISGI